jgi:hypothetical protein
MMKFEKSLIDLTMREMLAVADELCERCSLRLETTDTVLEFTWTEELVVHCENLRTEEIFEFAEVELSGEVAHAVLKTCFWSSDSL